MLVGCLTSQQQASASQGRICSDKFTCCHTEIQVADQTFYLTQSQYTDTGPTSPSVDPITPGAWQGSHWNANFEVTGKTRPRKKSRRKRDLNPGPSALEADALTTRPTRRLARRRRRRRNRKIMGTTTIRSAMGIYSNSNTHPITDPPTVTVCSVMVIYSNNSNSNTQPHHRSFNNDNPALMIYNNSNNNDNGNT